MDKEFETDWIVAEPVKGYSNDFLKDGDLPYKVIGICMDVHRELGRGFSEIVYKDAIGLELKWKNISYEREKKFEVNYKGVSLPHFYFADFVINNELIPEVKAVSGLIDNYYGQAINYLAVSKCQLGIIADFSERSLQYKRVILSK